MNDAKGLPATTELADWEYGFYDSDGVNPDDPHPIGVTVYWYTFGGLVGFDSYDMAMHTASKSTWGAPVIVRRRKGSTEWELAEEPGGDSDG